VPVDSAMYYYFHGILHCLSNIHHLNQLSNGDRCVCMCVFSKEVSWLLSFTRKTTQQWSHSEVFCMHHSQTFNK
jgi:hypothetical protein